jgi:DNA modification methylase
MKSWADDVVESGSSKKHVGVGGIGVGSRQLAFTGMGAAGVLPLQQDRSNNLKLARNLLIARKSKAPTPAWESLANSDLRSLEKRYGDRVIITPELTRALVSFQANKSTPFYRWFKYKEAFSHEFVSHVLERFRPKNNDQPSVLDPFAGVGTTLTAATRSGWRATGIELLPIGTAAIKARLMADTVDLSEFEEALSKLRRSLPLQPNAAWKFSHLRITEKAFASSTQRSLEAYVDFVNKIESDVVRYLFWFAALSILEEISYTRKDGQYLRWDKRSGRKLRSAFDKGRVSKFDAAILNKLELMKSDLMQRDGTNFSRSVDVIEGSCLQKLPVLSKDSFDLAITSPPYCNRYDYTRTYALELAFMGCTEDLLRSLRQSLLSATVENKAKCDQLEKEYAERGDSSGFDGAVKAFNGQRVLQNGLNTLKKARDRGELNNSNIPMMVENYFFEMNLVIRQLARVLAPNGHVVMVNDNVQYHGTEIPVDLILSDFAEEAGLRTEAIWVLPKGKGNSSQQMGLHGRNEIRKCVYVWAKC